jgi:cyclomaltodextrinase / maltogenic alpha-amylase / neopullulanase
MKNLTLFLALVFIVNTSFTQDKQLFGNRTARTSAPWVKNGIIYEIFPRTFSPEGTFAGIEAKLPELKKLGVTILWLMPIHPVGIEHRKGTLGSSYSVMDYYGVNPEYGTLNDFKHLVGKAHALGFKIVIDMVANHTSWDSKLIREHPDWFTKDSTGNIVSPVPDWSDVADLDYSKPGLRKYMITMLEYWVRDVGIDGYRCDVAEMVPTDFWNEARAALDKIKPVMMLSEGQLPEHHLEAFDLSYGWNLYQLLSPLMKGERSVAALDTLLKYEADHFPKQSLRMRFSSNHDENAWDNPDVVKFGIDGAKLAAAVVNTFPGVPLLYNGQETGNAVKLGLFEKITVDWNAHKDFRNFYTTLFNARKDHAPLRSGELKHIESADTAHVYAFFRTQGTETDLVVYNFSPTAVSTVLTLPSSNAGCRLTPLYTAPTTAFTINDARVKITLPGFGYGVYRVQ